ncbi:MAG: hypothetical protein ACO1NY_15460 [Pseudorhodoplanes sp.]
MIIICCAVTLALLFTVTDAKSQSAGQATAAPENPFSRWFRLPATAAAPAAAQPAQRVRKPRIASSRKRTKPVAAVPQPVPEAEQPAPQREEQVADSGWPNAEASVGAAMITPLTVKTVREQLETAPETQLVSENELSDIDRAAPSPKAATVPPAPSASTDGSGAIEKDAEQVHVFAMGDTIKVMMRSTWTEPVLLMLAGALGGLAASRLFV